MLLLFYKLNRAKSRRLSISRVHYNSHNQSSLITLNNHNRQRFTTSVVYRITAMADIAVAAPLPKRPFLKDEPIDDEMPNTPIKADSTIASSPLSSPANMSSRDVSELPSTATAARSPPPTSNPSTSNMPTSNTQKTAPPAKRRKLNPIEKAQAEAEKAAKKEAKEKEKAAKEKEKAEAAAKKEEDRKKKAEEQEQKRKAKEIENKVKEEEKSKKAAEAEAKKNAREEAKLKKERVSIILPSLYPFAEN